jgi:CRP-like cAMP-binding protein
MTGKPSLGAKGEEQALVNRLLQVPAFHRIPARHLQVLVKVGRARTAAVREVLGRPGDPCPGLWILLKGALAVREPGQPIRRVQPVSLVGEVALLSGQEFSEEVVVVEACELLEVPAQVFAAILVRSPEICQRLCRNVVGVLSARLQQANEALDELGRVRVQLAEELREAEVELNDLRVIHGYRE